MAIKDHRLKEFFSKQKVGAFDSLIIKGKPIVEKTLTESEVIASKNETLQLVRAESLLAIDETHSIKKQTTSESIKDNINDITISNIINNKSILPLAKSEQCESESLANSLQNSSKPLANRKQEAGQVLAIGEQTVSNVINNISELHFFDLMIFSKKERSLLSLIFEQCRNNGTLISPPISTEEIRSSLNISAERVRNLIFRITKKGGLKIVRYKNGQNAYRVFELPKSIYQIMIDSKTMQRFIEPLASISYNNISLPDEWTKINYENLDYIGFSETQLRQLHDNGSTMPEIVQDSINRFAYSLQYNEKAKAYNEPLNVLMGVLRKGQRWIEPNYIAPKDLALRQLIEDKKKQKEQYDAMIKELIELEFPEWRKKLSHDDIQKIVPAEILQMNITGAIQSSLRTYFSEKILAPRFFENE